MADLNSECGTLTLRKDQGEDDPSYPLLYGDIITIGSKNTDNIRIKGQSDDKTDAVLTVCRNTGFVQVSNPEKAQTILNDKPLLKIKYLIPGDVLHIKNSFFIYDSNIFTQEHIDYLRTQNIGSVRPVVNKRNSDALKKTELITLQGCTYQSEYIAGITPSRTNYREISNRRRSSLVFKTVNTAIVKRKRKLSRRYSADMNYLSLASPFTSIKTKNTSSSWNTPPMAEEINTPMKTPSTLRNSVLLRSAMQQEKKNIKRHNVESPRTSTSINRSSDRSRRKLEHVQSPKTPSTSVRECCSPRTLKMIQIASDRETECGNCVENPSSLKPRSTSLYKRRSLDQSTSFKSVSKRRKTDNFLLSRSRFNDELCPDNDFIKNVNKSSSSLLRRKSDFQNYLDDGYENVENIDRNESMMCNKSFTSEHTNNSTFIDIMSLSTKEQAVVEHSFNDDNSVPDIHTSTVQKGRRKASEILRQSTLTPIHSSEGRSSSRFGQSLRQNSHNKISLNSPERSFLSQSERRRLLESIQGKNATAHGSPVLQRLNEYFENITTEDGDKDISVKAAGTSSRDTISINSPERSNLSQSERRRLLESIQGKNATAHGSPVLQRLNEYFENITTEDGDKDISVKSACKSSRNIDFDKDEVDDKCDDLDVSGVEEISINAPTTRKSRELSDYSSHQDEKTNPLNDLTNVKKRKSPLNDLSDVAGVKQLYRNSPTDDLRDVEGVQALFKRQNTPKDDLRNVEGVQALFKRQNTPKNDLRNVDGVKNALRRRTIYNNLEDVFGVKRLFDKRTPRNNLDGVEGVKNLFKRHTPENDLTNVAGVKNILRKRSPRNSLSEVSGVKKLFQRKSPKNDLTKVDGVKDILRRRSAYNNLNEVVGVKRLYEQSPNNDLNSVEGVKKLFKRHTPENDLRNVDGVKDVLRRRTAYNNLSQLIGVKELYDEETPKNKVRSRSLKKNTTKNPDETPKNLDVTSKNLDETSKNNLNMDNIETPNNVNLFKTPNAKLPNKTITTGIKDLFDEKEIDEIVPKGAPPQDAFDALIGRQVYKTYSAKSNFESPDDLKRKVMNDSMTEAFESMKIRRKISKSLRNSFRDDAENSSMNSSDLFRSKMIPDSIFATPNIKGTSTPILKQSERLHRGKLAAESKNTDSMKTRSRRPRKDNSQLNSVNEDLNSSLKGNVEGVTITPSKVESSLTGNKRSNSLQSKLEEYKFNEELVQRDELIVEHKGVSDESKTVDVTEIKDSRKPKGRKATKTNKNTSQSKSVEATLNQVLPKTRSTRNKRVQAEKSDKVNEENEGLSKIGDEVETNEDNKKNEVNKIEPKKRGRKPKNTSQPKPEEISSVVEILPKTRATRNKRNNQVEIHNTNTTKDVLKEDRTSEENEEKEEISNVVEILPKTRATRNKRNNQVEINDTNTTKDVSKNGKNEENEKEEISNVVEILPKTRATRSKRSNPVEIDDTNTTKEVSKDGKEEEKEENEETSNVVQTLPKTRATRNKRNKQVEIDNINTTKDVLKDGKNEENVEKEEISNVVEILPKTRATRNKRNNPVKIDDTNTTKEVSKDEKNEEKEEVSNVVEILPKTRATRNKRNNRNEISQLNEVKMNERNLSQANDQKEASNVEDTLPKSPTLPKVRATRGKRKEEKSTKARTTTKTEEGITAEETSPNVRSTRSKPKAKELVVDKSNERSRRGGRNSSNKSTSDDNSKEKRPEIIIEDENKKGRTTRKKAKKDEDVNNTVNDKTPRNKRGRKPAKEENSGLNIQVDEGEGKPVRSTRGRRNLNQPTVVDDPEESKKSRGRKRLSVEMDQDLSEQTKRPRRNATRK